MRWRLGEDVLCSDIAVAAAFILTPDLVEELAAGDIRCKKMRAIEDVCIGECLDSLAKAGNFTVGAPPAEMECHLCACAALLLYMSCLSMWLVWFGSAARSTYRDCAPLQ